ncbi:DUF4340 domain-containing protein [bacterium]|nr:DUF4340 domain-containing protein [bacterium]
MKRLIIGILALALVIGGILYFKQDKSGTVEQKDIQFSVEEPENVTKIEMKNRDGKHIILEKKGDEWWVNNKYPAFQPAIDLFFNRTLTQIEVKGPVPKPARENVIRAMTSTAVKVNIYSGKKLINSYYVGGPDNTQKGTYMYVEGAETPYVAFIPGLDGYITPKFHMVEEDWYKRTIFDYEADEIKRVDVVYTEKPEESFSIKKEGDQFFISPDIDGEPVNQTIAKSYFTLFKFKNFEGFPEYLQEQTRDSILRSQPFITVTVVNTDGKSKTMKVYPKMNSEDQSLVDRKGNVLAYDPERYFATFTDFPELVTVQDYVFGKIFANRSDFYAR